MKIIIVGAGIGGLSAAIALSQAGHEVTVLEAAHALAEIGAGVQLTPVATRYFWKWGLSHDLLAEAVLPDFFCVRSDCTGDVLGKVDLRTFDDVYGASYIVVHRADVHRILHRHAVKAGAGVFVNCRVVGYDFEQGSVTLANGEEMRADLVVAADGINSFARSEFLPGGDWVEKTGWAAYRMSAPVDELRTDAHTAGLVASHTCNCFVGENQSVMTYMVKGAKSLNIVLSHPDDVDTSQWAQVEYQAAVTKLCRGWDDVITSLMAKVSGNIQNWPVYQCKTLPRWSSKSGRFVLLGDAAHAMSFYLSMGVSMAVEDAAALVECLNLCEQTKTPLRIAMRIFESVRKERAEAVREASLHAASILHMSPGPECDIRDEALRTAGASCDTFEDDTFYKQRVSYGILDTKIRNWSYGYDVVEAIKTA